MKTRQGFVSNSSSSSFIVTASEICSPTIALTTAVVAIEMLDVLLKDRYYWWYSQLVNTPSNTQLFLPNIDPEKDPVYSAILYLTKKISYDGPITFPWSCNYETYIWRDFYSSDIFVDTCDNNPWDTSGLTYFIIDEDRAYEKRKEIKFTDLGIIVTEYAEVVLT
jgi:hypothetical protein